MFFGALTKLPQFEVCVLDVPAHREVRAVDLKVEAGSYNRFVFRLHRP